MLAAAPVTTSISFCCVNTLLKRCVRSCRKFGMCQLETQHCDALHADMQHSGYTCNVRHRARAYADRLG